jgi:glucokinase
MDYLIAFDVGGTRIKYGIISVNGEMVKSGHVPSRANGGTDGLFKTISGFVEESIASYDGNPVAIGLGLSGGIHPDKGVVLLPGKFKSLEGYPIVELLKEKFNIPVFADNDGRLAAYAEKYYGAAIDKKWAVVITIGTGIGSGVIIDGRIIHDPRLQFGTQLGHIIMDKSGNQTCLTGNNGTGEVNCSSTSLTLQVRNCIQRGIPCMLTDDYFDNPLKVDFKRVVEACRAGDELCLKELNVWIESLAVLLINAVHCYAPEVIILSGGATLASDLFLDEVTEIVNKQVFRYPVDDQVKIRISDIQEYSGVMGAAAMAMKKLNYQYG